jgi:hypothetical protein
MREQLVQQGVEPAEAAQAAQVWKSRHSLGGGHDPFRFRRDFGLPDDPKAMTLDQLGQLIAYHDSLRKRHDQAIDRLAAMRTQIEAAMREHGSELVEEYEGPTARRSVRPGPMPPPNATGANAKSRPSVPTRSRC